MKRIRVNQYQSGVTSIFIVIFAALLLSVITLSFAGIMSHDLTRSSDDELSQSAYDSALAGVEDAKRVVMAAQNGNSAASDAIDDFECDTITKAGIAGNPGDSEVVIKSTGTGAGSELNQAYTCVKIELDSPDFELTLNTPGRSEIVPLRGMDDIHRVRIEWESGKDEVMRASCGLGALSNADANNLCPLTAWASGTTATAALLRAQFITPDNSFSLDDLDENSAGQTVFLYPTSAGGDIQLDALERYVSDYSNTGTLINAPRDVRCDAAIGGGVGGYHCSVDIELVDPISDSSEVALLRLTSIYQSTQVRVTLLDDSGQVVDFKGVQPVVDSTGRANDLFRRVEARLSLSSNLTYPEAALDVTRPLCKDFYVTDSQSGQVPTAFAGGNCTP